MIYILTSSDYDLSTNEVINWFLMNKVRYKRLNVNQFQFNENLKIKLTNFDNQFIFNGEKINFDDKCLIWYRRIGINRDDFGYKSELNFFNLNKYLNFRNSEWNSFMKIFFSLFSSKTIWFDNPINKINKTEVLLIAPGQTH